MNYLTNNFNKIFRDYTFKQVFIDFAIALLTVFIFPFMIFCLLFRSIFYKKKYEENKRLKQDEIMEIFYS